jgi:hypothetical protein
VDDVNIMDVSMDGVEQSPGGISRRDMIKASVIAGGLVWSAPMLLAGRASAAPSICCPTGFETAFAIKYTVGDQTGNCGVTCLDMDKIGVDASANNLPCPPPACLTREGIAVANFDNFGGTVTLSADVRVIAASVRTSRFCFFTECDDPDPAHAGPSTAKFTGLRNQCDDGTVSDSSCPTIVPDATHPNRIWVEVQPDSSTIVRFELVGGNPPVDYPGNSGIAHVEVYLCGNSRVTGRCP